VVFGDYKRSDPGVVSEEIAGLLALQEYLDLWFLSRAMARLEEYVEDAGERWRLLRELVEEALADAAAELEDYGSALTPLARHAAEKPAEALPKPGLALKVAGDGTGP